MLDEGRYSSSPKWPKPSAWTGFRVTVLYRSHASRELREASTAFHALDPYISDLALS